MKFLRLSTFILFIVTFIVCENTYAWGVLRDNPYDHDYPKVGYNWMYKNTALDTHIVKFIEATCVDTQSFYVMNKLVSYKRVKYVSKVMVFRYLNKEFLEESRDTFHLLNWKDQGIMLYNPRLDTVIKVNSIRVYDTLKFDGKYDICLTYPRDVREKRAGNFHYHLDYERDSFILNNQQYYRYTKILAGNPLRQERAHNLNKMESFNTKMGSTGYFFPYDVSSQYYYSGPLIYFYDPSEGYFYPYNDYGKVHFKVITSVEKVQNIVGFSLYPNPAQSILNIQILGEPRSKLMLSIFNGLGQKVYSIDKINTMQHSVEINSLPVGLYRLQITDGRKSVTKSFIKE